MNTFTLNRSLVTNDFMFIAACDHTCADLLDSYNMDKQIRLEVDTGKSLGRTLKRFFLGK